MGAKFIAAAWTVTALLAAGAGARPAPAGRTIILFGASWCAPCRIEVRALPSLAKAAAPDRLELAWVDRPPVRANPAANVRILSIADARGRLERFAGDIAGFPATVMLDADGRRCGVLREPLTAAGIARLKAVCSAG